MILIAPKIIPKIAKTFPFCWFLDIWDKPIAEKTTAKIPTIPKKLRKKEIIPKTNPTIAKTL